MFDKAFELLIGHEGKFQANPLDRGNWTTGKIGQGQLKGTKYGISAMSYPDLDIKNLTLAEAKEIYRRDYWGKVRGDELPWHVAFNAFDMAVNSGPPIARITTQKALGVRADGVFGPVTLAAAAKSDPAEFSNAFYDLRIDYVDNNERQWALFGNGWKKRFKLVNQQAQGIVA